MRTGAEQGINHRNKSKFVLHTLCIINENCLIVGTSVSARVGGCPSSYKCVVGLTLTDKLPIIGDHAVYARGTLVNSGQLNRTDGSATTLHLGIYWRSLKYGRYEILSNEPTSGLIKHTCSVSYVDNLLYRTTPASGRRHPCSSNVEIL